MSKELYRQVVNLTEERYLAYDEHGELVEFPPNHDQKRAAKMLIKSRISGSTVYVVSQKVYERVKASDRKTGDLAYAFHEGSSRDGRSVHSFNLFISKKRVIPASSVRLSFTED